MPVATAPHVCWFRRDLRVRDNPALAAAAAGGANAVVPVFVWAPEEEGQFQSGRCSRWWYVAPLKRGSKEHVVLKGRGRPRGVCIARARLFPVRMTSTQPKRGVCPRAAPSPRPQGAGA